ncbi:MAG: membrane dipeptidase [Tissierellia bacterium]|nr:membrane dipeptidase [Tissierellia bacterium]MDD4779463.1 membrane dipeptidase [Tissierellia bacterium]
MLIFDAHSDLMTDITSRRMSGEKNVFLNRHNAKLTNGGVNALIAVVWMEPINYANSSNRMFQILKNSFAEFYPLENIEFPIRNAKELDTAILNNKMAIILGMEGLEGLEDDPENLYLLYELGLRHASLTWNHENFFATGVKAVEKNKGLTELGKRAIEIMDDLGILIDVSHANEKSFWDIMELSSGPIIASHSNAYSLCQAPRNLKDDQIKAIAKTKGVIGINAWHEFIDSANPCVEKLADHVDYIANMIGIDHLAFGFDFTDYLEDDSVSSFRTGKPQVTKNLKSSDDIPNFIKELRRRGYTNEELKKMGYSNLRNVFEIVTEKNNK